MLTAGLRIGAVAHRTGVAVPTLRAWESRYGVLQPARTDGGQRRYTEADVERVLAVLRLTAQGWSVSAAAASVTAERSPSRLGLVGGDATGAAHDGSGTREPDAATARFREGLAAAISGFDAAHADRTLDGAFARFGVAFTLEDVVMPVLRDLGEGWREDPMLIASEHFATNTLRPRLQRLLHAAVATSAPTCLAAAPDGEDHELGVLAAAAVAADAGFRVTYLGSSTPSIALSRSAGAVRPDVLLIGAMTQESAERFLASIPDVGTATMVLGGAGFDAMADDALPARARRATTLTDLPRVLRLALELSADGRNN